MMPVQKALVRRYLPKRPGLVKVGVYQYMGWPLDCWAVVATYYVATDDRYCFGRTGREACGGREGLPSYLWQRAAS